MTIINKTTAQINTLLDKINPTEVSVDILEDTVDVLENSLGNFTFIPSMFTSTKIATSFSIDQSEPLDEGVTIIRIANLDVTHGIYISLGNSHHEAQYNSDFGMNNINRFYIKPNSISYIMVGDYSYYGWLGSSGIVEITQGV